MKTKIIFFSIIVILTIFKSESKAWDTTAAKYYPLNIGDVYVYVHQNLFLDCINISNITFRVEITGDTIMPNGKKYFILLGFQNQFQRIDSSTMNVYSYENGIDVLLDSLLCNNLDSFNGKRNPVTTQQAIIYAGTISLFGQTRNSKLIFDGIKNSAPYIYILVEGFGLSIIDNCSDLGGFRLNLVGCIINGVVYGDTTVGIRQVSSINPERFSLKQNYPNPFNPVTVISYSLPVTRFISIKVYDVLGNEVVTLVNEKQNAGSYEVEFDGANYPSGVYYYKFETGDFSEVRKMILLK